MADRYKVFISWSGDLAKAVAAVWHDLLIELFDGVAPFMSEKDVGAGQRGLNVIASELAGTKFGIVVVTQDNQHSQWLNYESGALSKNVNDEPVHVAPSLVDFDKKGDATGPLSQFQGTLLNEEGIGEILLELAKVVGVQPESVVKRFSRAWRDEYAERFGNAKAESVNTGSPSRNPEDMLDEILTLVREIAGSSRPAVSLTKLSQPSRTAVRRAIGAVLGDESRWRARVGPRGVDVTLPAAIAEDVEDKLTIALGNVPYVDVISLAVAPGDFFDEPEPSLEPEPELD